MDLQYYGANCLRINTKKAQIVVDDNLEELGQKTVTKKGDIALFTSDNHKAPSKELKLLIDIPGEYEVSGVSIQGVPARSHMDEEGKRSAIIYKIIVNDISLAIAGHIHPDLQDTQLEALGMIDVLVIPVGGNGYTLDGVGARKIVKETEPKLVIPTHYDEGGLNFPVPQQTLEQAFKGLSMEPSETVPKLKLKASDLGEVTQLIVLEKS